MKFMGSINIKIWSIAENSPNIIKTLNITRLLTTKNGDQIHTTKENYLKQYNIEGKYGSVNTIINSTVDKYFAKEDTPLKIIGIHEDIDGVNRIEGVLKSAKPCLKAKLKSEPLFSEIDIPEGVLELVKPQPEAKRKSDKSITTEGFAERKLGKLYFESESDNSADKEFLEYVSSDGQNPVNKEFLDYISSVRYVPGDGCNPAIMPALDSPYDEFPSFVDVEEPYATDDDDEDDLPPRIEEP